MCKQLTAKQVRFWDANNVAWIWDSDICRVYAEGTIEEDPQSGYPAYSLNEALEVLEQGGYMDD